MLLNKDQDFLADLSKAICSSFLFVCSFVFYICSFVVIICLIVCVFICLLVCVFVLFALLLIRFVSVHLFVHALHVMLSVELMKIVIAIMSGTS